MKIKFVHIIIGWTAFAIVMTVLMYFFHPDRSTEASLLTELPWELAFSIVWIPATPLVLALSRRFTVSKKSTFKNGTILFVAGMLLSFLLCFGHAVVLYLISPDAKSFNVERILYSFFYNIDNMLVVYWALVILQQALTYYGDIQEKEIKASHLETQLAQAQMQALKMQLQPHFLFNTLNAIVTLVHKNPEQAEEMIVRLSNFLRLTLDASGKQMVTLQEELSFVKTYLEIEKVRFEGKLSFYEQIPPELLNAQVPLLLLQPLIENAVKHGISKYISASVLELHACTFNGSLKISIKDDGAPVEVVTASLRKEGIGFANTRARLESLYGKNATLETAPNSPHGFIATVTLPLTIDPTDED